MERKLTAILSADVKGYSRLMGEDEEATIRTLTAYRQVMTSLIQQHHGRVVDSPGDNLLAEFASAVDAVQGAVKIQRELKVRNTELPAQRQMEFRIGINVGDVVVEEEKLYGDGVNIAVRLEGLAEPGGICISGTVHDQVENKLALSYEYLGEQAVKNIAKPVRVWRVQWESEATATMSESVLRQARPEQSRRAQHERLSDPVTPSASSGQALSVSKSDPHALTLALPDKPSLAVLPFTNMSGIAEGKRAIALDPNDAEGYVTLGMILSCAGRSEDAIRLIEQAMRLNPHYPAWYAQQLGLAYRLAGRYEEATAAYQRALARNPDFQAAHVGLAAIYSESGREAEARAEVAEVLRLNPQFSLEALRRESPYKDQAVWERDLAALYKAGLQ